MRFDVGLAVSVKRKQNRRPSSRMDLLTPATSAVAYPRRRCSGGVYTGPILMPFGVRLPYPARETGPPLSHRTIPPPSRRAEALRVDRVRQELDRPLDPRPGHDEVVRRRQDGRRDRLVLPVHDPQMEPLVDLRMIAEIGADP